MENFSYKVDLACVIWASDCCAEFAEGIYGCNLEFCAIADSLKSMGLNVASD